MNENLDCLSRIPIAVVPLQSKDADDIVREQSNDPLCQDIRSYMEDRILWDEIYRNMPEWAKEIDFFFVKIIFCARLKPQLQKNEDRSFIDRSSCHYLCESL